MRNRSPIGSSRWKKLVLRAAALAGLGTPIVVGILNAPAIRAQGATDWQTRAGGKMAFDVASIKPSKGAFVPSNFPLDPSGDYGATNGRLSADETLAEYIEFAYKVWGNEVQSREFSHLPKWLNTDRYTIEARAATSNPTKDQMRLMVQALLADRFRLAAHFEVREVPVFELRLAKSGKPGPKLISHADGPPCDKPDASPVADVPSFHFVCHTFSPFLDLGTTLTLGSRDVSMDVLAGTLSEALAGPLAFGRPIIDKTGLTGRFDFTLEFARERRAPAGADSPVASDPIGPTPLEALRDQLGLKLDSTKAAIPILVIDKVERPSEN
jgi:bla regulator protein BlaR1